MTMVIAFTGTIGAVICGDRREMRFYEGGDSETLEYELYNGIIRTDSELIKRSADLGVRIEIRDNKEKIFTSGNILVGTVTSHSAETERQRRMYVAPGRYLIAEIVDGKVRITETGESAFLVLGNAIAKKISGEVIGRAKRPKRLSDAVRVLIQVMEFTSQKTASVSHAYDMIQIPPLPEGRSPRGSLYEALEQDMKQNHWRML
ncbi:MAG: DUF2121 domain-containing protein [Euryarchaeota archaeon]|nr:DUF2121 domain-containing protein [Euryarchaeota archaeon]